MIARLQSRIAIGSRIILPIVRDARCSLPRLLAPEKRDPRRVRVSASRGSGHDGEWQFRRSPQPLY